MQRPDLNATVDDLMACTAVSRKIAYLLRPPCAVRGLWEEHSLPPSRGVGRRGPGPSPKVEIELGRPLGNGVSALPGKLALGCMIDTRCGGEMAQANLVKLKLS
jgi:hypothetical protein